MESPCSGSFSTRARPALGAPFRSRRRNGKRAVAEVVATIILLALTVVLFSAIFAFVTSFPSPPAQSNNQFQASLGYTVATNGTTYITAVNVLHLAGPAVPSTALIYLKSAAHPTASQFQTSYSLTRGGIATNWNLGQTWSISFPTGVASLPDNLTVYVVSSDAVLFSVILPGQSFVLPPTFVALAVSPSSPTVGSSFNITATVTGSAKEDSVYVNLAAITGLTATAQHMQYNSATGQYYLDVTSKYGSTTAAGTFYAFLNATGANGQSSTTALAVTIAAGSTTTVPPASLAVAPSQGVTKASMTAAGSGFTDATSVSLTFNGAAVTMTACAVGTLATGKTSVTTSASGTFSCTFAIPSETAGTYSVVATDATSGQTGTALFAVTTPALTTYPTATVAPGKGLWVNGTGFSVSSTVGIYYKDGSVNTTVGTSTNPCIVGSLVTTGTGTFSCEFTVPSTDSTSGTSTLSVQDVSSTAWVTKTMTN